MAGLKKILLVDDEEDLREALAEQLAATEDFEVAEAGTGAEAVEKAKGAIYDLVVLDVALPAAGFCLWAAVPPAWEEVGHKAGLGSDEAFARDLLAQYNVTVLPGSYLARPAQGFNPGAGRIRMALVAETAECLEAAQRIVALVNNHTAS